MKFRHLLSLKWTNLAAYEVSNHFVYYLILFLYFKSSLIRMKLPLMFPCICISKLSGKWNLFHVNFIPNTVCYYLLALPAWSYCCDGCNLTRWRLKQRRIATLWEYGISTPTNSLYLQLSATSQTPHNGLLIIL